jgi:hypothetical protein
MRRINGFPRTDVHAHVGEHAFTPGGAKTTCAWPDPKPM